MEDASSIVIKSLIAGVSCSVAGFATNPLDVVKIRLQEQKVRYYHGFWDGCKKVTREEGFGALLKG